MPPKDAPLFNEPKTDRLLIPPSSNKSKPTLKAF
jgi:hypothetical protein